MVKHETEVSRRFGGERARFECLATKLATAERRNGRQKLLAAWR